MVPRGREGDLSSVARRQRSRAGSNQSPQLLAKPLPPLIFRITGYRDGKRKDHGLMLNVRSSSRRVRTLPRSNSSQPSGPCGFQWRRYMDMTLDGLIMIFPATGTMMLSARLNQTTRMFAWIHQPAMRLRTEIISTTPDRCLYRSQENSRRSRHA